MIETLLCCLLAFQAEQIGAPQMLDDGTDATVWQAAPSEGVDLTVTSDGDALHLDFDFHRGGGWAAALRPLQLELPEDFRSRLRIRGSAPSNPLDLARWLPARALQATFNRYVAERLESSRLQQVYTPYELRSVGALVRLGRREEAWELLRLFLADRRPAGWRQWAEVVDPDPRGPRFVASRVRAATAAERG